MNTNLHKKTMSDTQEMMNGDVVVLTASYNETNGMLTLTLSVNGTPQKLKLTSASPTNGTPKGILVSGVVDANGSISPSISFTVKPALV